jgi:hypothetical protein
MSTYTIQSLYKWRKWTTMNFQQMLAENNIPVDAVRGDASVYKLNGLTTIDHLDFFPALFHYYPSGDLAIIQVYSGAIEDLSPQDIFDFYGTEESTERSRAGKTANYYVYAKEGFAFSSLKDEVHFLDLFPKTSTEEYLENIYENPPLFIR